MKCVNCGYETAQDYAFCPECGTAVQPVTPPAVTPEQPGNPAAETVLQALKHPLFLVLCILMSAYCALTLVSTGPDVLTILFTIFLWLTYAKSREDIADAGHLRCISGTFYANYIITNVFAILVIVMGVILGLALSLIGSDPAFINELISALDLGAEVTSLLGQFSGAVIGIIFLVGLTVAGVLMLTFNLFANHRIHRFAKSVYQSVQTGRLELQHSKAAHSWLWVFGIFSGISLLGELRSGELVPILRGAVDCAMPIIAAILVKNALLDQE